MGDIHFLTEAHLGTSNQQNDIVELLEDLLVRAKKGEIIGLSVAFVMGNNTPVTNIASGCASADHMMLAILSLENRMKKLYFSLTESISFPDKST